MKPNPRTTPKPYETLRSQDGFRARMLLTSDMADHDGMTPDEPEGRWAMGMFMIWNGTGFTAVGNPERVWDPWGGFDDRNYQLVTDDECKVEYVPGPNRLEVYDAPCPE